MTLTLWFNRDSQRYGLFTLVRKPPSILFWFSGPRRCVIFAVLVFLIILRLPLMSGQSRMVTVVSVKMILFLLVARDVPKDGLRPPRVTKKVETSRIMQFVIPVRFSWVVTVRSRDRRVMLTVLSR